MKSLTCKMCDVTVTGATEAEVMGKMSAHNEQAHKEESDKMKAGTKEEQDMSQSDMKKMIKDTE